MFVLSVVCCQVDFCDGLITRPESDHESSIKRRPWPTGGLLRYAKKKNYIYI
jgi:hypothetical protein